MDLIDFGRYFAALLLVLGLLGAAALGTRRLGFSGIVKSATTRRLSLVETLMVGPRHKLFLLRRDGVEHLVLMGPQGASVVETGIVSPVAALQPAAALALPIVAEHSAEVSRVKKIAIAVALVSALLLMPDAALAAGPASAAAAAGSNSLSIDLSGGECSPTACCRSWR